MLLMWKDIHYRWSKNHKTISKLEMSSRISITAKTTRIALRRRSIVSIGLCRSRVPESRVEGVNEEIAYHTGEEGRMIG